MINILLSRGILASDQVYNVAKNLIKPDMKVLIAYFSFFLKHLPDQATYDEFYADSNEYQQKMFAAFARYGIPQDSIDILNYYHDDLATLQTKIKAADLIYYPGGAPDEMMARFTEKGILDDLKAFQGIVVGSSAGAMIQLKYYHIAPDYDYKRFEINPGLGYLDYLNIEVHYRRRIKQKKAIRKTAMVLQNPIYIIPDDSALVIQDNNITCIKNAKLYYTNKGKVK